MQKILAAILANKHTSIAGLVFFVAKYGAQLLSIWMPDHKEKLDATANLIEGAAAAYGFIAAGDASLSAKAHAESQSQIAGIQRTVNLVPSAISTGDTSMLKKSANAIPPATPPVNPPVASTPTTL